MPLDDLTGKKFGLLTVVKRNEKRPKNRVSYWDCICDCGGNKTTRGSALKAGKVKSCGCLQEQYKKSHTTMKDIIGKRFGRLLVVEMVDERSKCGEIKYLCKCDCGNEKIIVGTSMRNGSTRSCGCLISEETARRAKIHGQSNTRLYKIWSGMIERCINPNRNEYMYYGGRGINVCNEWLNDFKSFYEWAMSHGYSDDLSIDRIDVNGNYCPENCRWATPKEQSDNTRKTVHITVNGVTKNATDWAKTIGVGRSTISRHVKKGDIEEYISSML